MTRPNRSLRKSGLWLASGLIGFSAAAQAAPSPNAAVEVGKARAISGIEAAQLLIQSNHFIDARRVLDSLEKSTPNDNEVQFLQAMLDVNAKLYSSAIHRFRGILVRDPKAVRVRLELARTFYLAKDYDNAERQFRFARAGNLPDPVTQNIDHYVAAIRGARRFTYNFSVALAPDTNINVGPTTTTVGLYGLPFTLSPDARQRSGVGINVSAGGEWSPRISKIVRGRIGVQVNTTDYRTSSVDDSTVSAYAGPRILTGRWEISPLLSGFNRWYGNRFYNRGLGGNLQTIYYPNAKTGLSATVGAQEVTFAAPAGQGGLAISGSLGFFRILSPASVLSGAVSMARQNAGLSVYANTVEQVRAGLDRDLTHGITISVQPSYARINYDAAQAAFGVPRRDRQVQMQVSILNRRIDLYGFTPRLAYTFTHNASNISLYAYDRSQVHMGLTRAF